MYIFKRKHEQPVLHDCDLCGGEEIWCRAFSCGESNVLLFICSHCEIDMNSRIESKKFP